MYSLADFLNHGILPFTGRLTELEALVGFWRTTPNSTGLRVATLTGEAGIGKSRLLEALPPLVAKEGGMTVHTKLYPDSAASLAPLVARSLWKSASALRLMQEEPEGSLHGATAALRRLARIRPVILVLEDLHLLQSETLGELSAFLHSLVDEPLSILCAARALDAGAKGIIEPYLVSETHLSGLGSDDLADLWRRIFNDDAEDQTIATLLATTAGNPLALRSALRSAVRAGALVHDGRSGAWRLAADNERFARLLERGVQTISEGMAAHLGEEERHAAEALAWLGEVHSFEAACVMLDREEEMLKRLLFKGIVTMSDVAPMPLSGSRDETQLLAFTHTLVHRHFVDADRVDADRLAAIVASALPLYSILPFQLLAHQPGRVADASLLRVAAERAVDVARSIDRTADWKLAIPIWECASRYVDALGERIDPNDRRRMECVLLKHKLALLRREEEGDDYYDAAARMLELTRESDDLLELRMLALIFLDINWERGGRRSSHGFVDQIEALLEERPELRTTEAYVFYLTHLAHGKTSDRAALRAVEHRLDTLLASPECSEQIRRKARMQILPLLLMSFDSAEGLDRRLAFLEELSAEDKLDGAFHDRTLHAHFYLEIGRYQEALTVVDAMIPAMQERGLVRSYCSCTLNRILIDAAFGMDCDSVADQVAALHRTAPDDFRDTMNRRIARHFVRIGVLRGDHECGRDMARLYHAGSDAWSIEARVACAARDRDLSALDGIEDSSNADLLALVSLVRGGGSANEESIASIRRLLARELLRIDDLVRLHATLDLLSMTAGNEGTDLVAAHACEIAGALTRALEWLARRCNHAFILSIVERYGTLLGARAARNWKERAVAIERDCAPVSHGTRRIELSMIGDIAITRDDAGAVRVRGGRQRLFLAILVADRMLKTPLSFRELARLVGGEEEDPERQRKALNDAVYRVRDLLGHDAIVTDAETPQLDLSRVRVDLLEAHSRLERASTALHDGMLMQAATSLAAAMEIAAGGLPFPTLYQDFFEAARADFECSMRDLVIDVTKRLLAESDITSAETILRHGLRLMPEDGELADLLCDTLARLGQRTEAERVKLVSG